MHAHRSHNRLLLEEAARNWLPIIVILWRIIIYNLYPCINYRNTM